MLIQARSRIQVRGIVNSCRGKGCRNGKCFDKNVEAVKCGPSTGRTKRGWKMKGGKQSQKSTTRESSEISAERRLTWSPATTLMRQRTSNSAKAQKGRQKNNETSRAVSRHRSLATKKIPLDYECLVKTGQKQGGALNRVETRQAKRKGW